MKKSPIDIDTSGQKLYTMFFSKPWREAPHIFSDCGEKPPSSSGYGEKPYTIYDYVKKVIQLTF